MTRKPQAIRENEAQPKPKAGYVRPDGRAPRELRKLKFERNVLTRQSSGDLGPGRRRGDVHGEPGNRGR